MGGLVTISLKVFTNLFTNLQQSARSNSLAHDLGSLKSIWKNIPLLSPPDCEILTGIAIPWPSRLPGY